MKINFDLLELADKRGVSPFVLFFGGLWGVQIVILILFIFNLKDYSLNFTMPYRILFAVYCVMVVQKNDLYNKFFNNDGLVLIGVFYVLLSYRIFYDGFISDKYLGTPGTVYLLRFFSFIVIPSLAFAIGLDKESGEKAKKGIKYSCVIFLLIGLTYYGREGGGDYRALAYQEYVTEENFISPMAFAYIGFSLMGVVVWELLFEKSRLEIKSILLLALAFYAMFYGGSRNVFFAMPFMFIYLFTSKANSVKNFAYAVLLFCILMCCIFIINSYSNSGVMGRFEILYDQIIHGDPDAGSMRLYIWKKGLEEYFRSPFFGSGIEVSAARYQAHNMYLESIMSTGIFGGLIFLLIIIITLYNGKKLLKKESGLGWLVILFVERLMTGAVSSSILDPLFWLPVVAINANSRRVK